MDVKKTAAGIFSAAADNKIEITIWCAADSGGAE